MNTEMEQLRDDIRATAPEPRADFAEQLERRAEAGFAKPAKAPRAWKPLASWTPAIAMACALLVGTVILIGSAGTTSDDGAESGGGGVESLSSEGEAPSIEPDSGGGGLQSAPPDPSSDASARVGSDSALKFDREADRRTADGRRIVEQRTALALLASADRFDEVTADVLRVADDTGTIVQSSSISERNGRGFARYDLRVPSSRLDDVMADLSRLAKVTSRRESTDDITNAYVSASDRLADARAERQALLKALQNADTTAEADALRYRIRLARDRIVIAERDVAALRQRADRSRVSVTVRSTGEPAKDEGGAWTPGDALDDAGRILEVAAGVVLVTLAALLPLAILVAFGFAASRILRRRQREAALSPR